MEGGRPRDSGSWHRTGWGVGLRGLAHQEVCVILTGLASQTPPHRDSGRLGDGGCCVSGSWIICFIFPCPQDPAWGPVDLGELFQRHTLLPLPGASHAGFEIPSGLQPVSERGLFSQLCCSLPDSRSLPKGKAFVSSVVKWSMAVERLVTSSLARLSYITQNSFSWVFSVKVDHE